MKKDADKNLSAPFWFSNQDYWSTTFKM
jgi:hypothetical protein